MIAFGVRHVYEAALMRAFQRQGVASVNRGLLMRGHGFNSAGSL